MSETAAENGETTGVVESDSTLRAIAGVERPLDRALLLRVIGLVWITLVSWHVAGSWGVAVGLAIATSAVVARPIIVAGIAHAGLLLLVPDLVDVTDLIELGLFELGVGALLLSEPPVDRPAAVLTVAVGLTMGGATIAADIRAGGLAPTVVLLAVVAVVAYGIHRYEQVALGLVVERRDTDGRADTRETIDTENADE